MPLTNRRLRAFDGERRRRPALLSAIVVVHVLLILWLVSQARAVQPAAGSRGESMITIATSSGERESAPSNVPVKVARAVVRAPIPPPILLMPSMMALMSDDASAEPAAQSGAGGCATASDVGLAIRDDPAAMAELAALPRTIRTEADAVMIWNGEWMDWSSPPGKLLSPTGPLATMRSTIERVVAAAPEECREAATTGPVLVPIPEGERTTMLVFGSGAWRWSDLLADPALCTAGDIAQCLVALQTP